MSEDRVMSFIQAAATLICTGVLMLVVYATARKHGGTIPGMVARMLKWFARWVTNLAIQYDVFLSNWRAYVKNNPIVMQCEVSDEPPITNVQLFKRVAQ